MCECYSAHIIQGLSDQNVGCFFKSKLLERTPLLVAGGVTDEGESPGETMQLILSLKDTMLAKNLSSLHVKCSCHHVGKYAKQAITS